MSGLESYHGLIFIRGMGAHVKKTVSSKKDLRPHTSDNAPIRGALRNDNRPWKSKDKEILESKSDMRGMNIQIVFGLKLHLF